MRNSGVVGLVVLAALSVAAAGIVTFSGRSAPTDPRIGKQVLPEVAARPIDIAKIVLTHGGGTITFDAAQNAWTVAEKSGYPADHEKMRKLLIGLTQITYVEPKTAAPDLYPRLQVEDPAAAKSQSTLVEVDDGKGATMGKVIVGRRRIDELGGGNDGVYVRLEGEAQSWLARGTLELDGDVVQWLDRRVVDIDQKRIKEAALAPAGGESLTIQRDKPEDKFTLKELPAGRKLKSDTALVEPATVLMALDLSDVRAAKDLPFPQEGVGTARFSTFDGLLVKLALLKQGETDWIMLAAEGEDEKAKAEAASLNQRWSNWVYGIPAYKGNALTSKLADLLEAPSPQTSQAPQSPAPPEPAATPSPAPRSGAKTPKKTK